MTKFEEDMEFAKDVLRIREALISGCALQHPDISCYSSSGDGNIYNSYYIDLGNNESFEFAFLETTNSNGRSYIAPTRVIYTPGRDKFIDVHDLRKAYNFSNFEYEEMDEAWHFQRSLIYNDDILRAFVVFKTLSTRSMQEYNYFSLFFDTIPEVIKRLDEVQNGNI